MNKWAGHSFYYEALKTLENLTSNNIPRNYNNIQSIPVWFNKNLQTTFDSEISRAGFNFIKDLFPGGQRINLNDLINYRLSRNKKNKIIHMANKTPLFWVNELNKYGFVPTAVLPDLKINFLGTDQSIINLDSKHIYRLLISKIVRLPKGILNWCNELELTDLQIQTALTFTHNSCLSTFDRVFQYKIITNILPTNDYLKRYLVKDSNICDRCQLEFDSVCHSLYDCEKVVPIISNIFSLIIDNCRAIENINMTDYLFGIHGCQFDGVNHVLLELKKFLFYDWKIDVSVDDLCANFVLLIIKIIIKEKKIYQTSNNINRFYSKWEKFKHIYDFRGPDIQII